MSPALARQAQVQRSGFTLIELVVALSLTVLITLAAFGGLQLAARAGDKGSEHSARTSEIRLVRDWIRRQIEHAQPIMIQQDTGESVVAFWGDGRSMRFLAPLPAHLGGGGLSVLTLGVDDGQSPQGLVLEHQLFHPDIPVQTRPPKQERLLDAVRDARFRFYGARDEGEEPMWHDRWDAVKVLPSLISLEIGFDEKQRKEWITLIATPMIDGKTKRGTVLVNGESHDTAGK